MPMWEVTFSAWQWKLAVRLVHFCASFAPAAPSAKKLNMHRVRLLDCFCQNMFVCFCQKNAVPFQGRIKRPEIYGEFLHNGFPPVGDFVGRNHGYPMSLLFRWRIKLSVAMVVPLFAPKTSQITVTFMVILWSFLP
ncbi:MAG: hypothetical protein ACLRSW_10845 [Christensenellaceae bacterium]